MAEGVRETLSRIEARPGVIGLMVINEEGAVIRTNLDYATTTRYADRLRPLTMQARSVVRNLDPQNDLTFLRIRLEQREIMIGLENKYLLITIQEVRQQSTGQ